MNNAISLLKLFIGKHVFQNIRKSFYLLLSERPGVINFNSMVQPVLTMGDGSFKVDRTSGFGVYKSPGFYSSYTYMEARHLNSKIEIGKNTQLDNNCVIIANKNSIEIGESCLIGWGVKILSSDFHQISSRNSDAPIKIGDGVFIGSETLILKGVTIGENAIIGANSVVTKSIPANSLAAGNPCRVIRKNDIN